MFASKKKQDMIGDGKYDSSEETQVGPFTIIASTTNKRLKPSRIRNTCFEDFHKGRGVDYRRFTLQKGTVYTDAQGRQYKEWDNDEDNENEYVFCVRIPKTNNKKYRETLEDSGITMPDVGDVLVLCDKGIPAITLTVQELSHKAKSATALIKGNKY